MYLSFGSPIRVKQEQIRLGIGIIGAGNIMRTHAVAYRCLPEIARLVAIADLDIKRANAAKREHDCAETYSDYRELLARDDIQVISICTPPHLHSRMVIDALAAGKHVLCEKPMARILEEADMEIEAAAQREDLKFSCVYQYRSDPAHRRVRAMIRNNWLGKILMATVRVRAKRMPGYYSVAPSRGSRKIDGGGVLINQAIHQLDALISFLGNPIEASAVMNTFLQPTEGEDTLVGWVKFENGAFATIDCTVCAHEDWFAIEVLGENAQTTLSRTIVRSDCAWTVASKSSAVARALRMKGLRDFPSLPSPQPLWRVRAEKLASKLRGRKYLPPWYFGHTPYVREFLNSIRSSGPAPVPPAEARRSLELATGLYAAAVTGETIRFPIGPGHAFYAGLSCAEQVTEGKTNRDRTSLTIA
jgi:UDP-N-acetyl-2-amino-2-deoxyglucuronate dehydrogenase